MKASGKTAQKPLGLPTKTATSPKETKVDQNNLQPASPTKRDNILETLLQPEQASDFMPYQLKRRKKKRRRKNLNNNQ
jgi:hypothetical protein